MTTNTYNRFTQAIDRIPDSEAKAFAIPLIVALMSNSEWDCNVYTSPQGPCVMTLQVIPGHSKPTPTLEPDNTRIVMQDGNHDPTPIIYANITTNDNGATGWLWTIRNNTHFDSEWFDILKLFLISMGFRPNTIHAIHNGRTYTQWSLTND